MSLRKNRPEAERWLLAAAEDLRAADYLYQAAMYAQCCLLAQQCGEKTLKAIWHLKGESPRGRSVERLLIEFPYLAEVASAQTWFEWARLLDRLSLAALSPMGLSDQSSMSTYPTHSAERALDTARRLLEDGRAWFDGH